MPKLLKPVQLTALRLIASGTPDCQVASTLNVSVMSVYRWKRLPAFEAKLNSITSSGMEQIATTLNAAAISAAETLSEILNDMSQPTNTRMRAALGVLNALGPVNSALERGLQHRAADFDLAQRFNLQGNTYEAVRQSGKDSRDTITI